MLVLVDGNVGNSQRQDKYNGSCYFSVGCYGYIFRKGISYNLHQKKWYISATLLLCIITSFRGAGEENKGCARHGFREKKMKKMVLLLVLSTLLTLCYAQNSRFRVAILDMKAGVNRTQSQVDGLVDMLSVELFNAGDFSIVERTLVDKVIQEQNFQMSDLTLSQRKKIGGLLNADAIITGTVNYIIRDRWASSDGGSMSSGEYNVDIRMIDVSTGEILASAGDEQGSGTERELMRRIARQLVKNYSTSGNRNVTTISSTSNKPYVLLGYLYVFPQDIVKNAGNYPEEAVKAINRNKAYGYNDWRLPTSEELEILEAQEKEIGLERIDGILKYYCIGYVCGNNCVEYYYNNEGREICYHEYRTGSCRDGIMWHPSNVRLVRTDNPEDLFYVPKF